MPKLTKKEKRLYAVGCRKGARTAHRKRTRRIYSY